jgi:hypothetical protein
MDPLLAHFAPLSPVTGNLANVESMNKGPWYHGTTGEYAPGDQIEHHYWKKYPDRDDFRENSPLYVTSNPALAGHIADLRERQSHGQKPGRMYEVRPGGPLRPDETANPTVRDDASWKTSHPLHVVREVPRHEWPQDLGSWRREAAVLEHFEAAARPGRGQESCSCCGGTGEHGDGSSCDRCGGTGTTDKGARDPHCPGQAQPRRRHWRQGAAVFDRHFDPSDTYGLHAIEYRSGGTQVGRISWNPESGTVDRVETHPDYRRQGIATRLWHDARSVTPHLRHDTPDEMSDDGLSWARAVGGPNAPSAHQGVLEHFGAAAQPGQPQPRRKPWRKTAISHWQHRDCGVYAKALTDADPGLRIGAVAGPHSNPAEGHALHWFAHDDTHAYDSLGRHKLPYVNVWDSAYHGYFPPESHERMGFRQVLDVPPHHFGELTGEQSKMLPAARRHIREKAVLEGRGQEHQGVLEHFEAADDPGVSVEHHVTASGGATYPHLHTFTATHPDGAQASLSYMLSKRNSKGVVDRAYIPKDHAHDLGVPLVRAARSMHPDSFIKGLPGLDEDWGRHLPGVTSLHRNLTMKLEPADRDYIHDESVPRAKRAAHLMGLMSGRTSMHWASQRGRAAAEGSFGDHEFRSPEHTQIALSARPPAPEHVENDPERISRNGGYAYQAPDWEVPVREGAPVTVNSVRWRTGPASWTSHRFRDGHQFNAARQGVLEHFEAGYEEASPQAREHREDRVSSWLDRNTKADGTVPLPKSWGPHVEPHEIPRLEDHGWPADADQREDHWGHLAPERVSLRQQVHVHQPWVHRDAMEEKRDLDAGEHELGRPYDEEHARFVRHQGNTYLIDGHHRYARARLTGKDSMTGVVADTSRESDQPRNCPECREMHADDDEPVSHEASAGHLGNPLTGGHEWFHGTRAPRAELEKGFEDTGAQSAEAYQTPEEEPGGHWNAFLGTHFAASHQLARSFGEGEHESGANDWGEHSEPAVVHARLHLRNPRVYKSEYDLDDDVYEHEHAAGNRIGHHLTGDDDTDSEIYPTAHHLHQTYGDREIPRRASTGAPGFMGIRSGHPDRTQWLNAHPERWSMAGRHKARLEAAGHDGIVYGNEYEHSGEGHEHADVSAIAFRPHQIEMTRHHDADSDEHEPELNGHLAAGVVAHFEGSAGHLDLYHHTTPEKAAAITGERRMLDQQGRQKGPLYFSDVPHGFYGGGYGPEAVHVRVPRHLATENDSFGGGTEKFYTVRASDLKPEHFIGSEHQAAVVAHFEAEAADHVAAEPNRAVHAAVEEKVRQEHPHLDQAPEDRTGTLRKMLGQASFFMPCEDIDSATAPEHGRTVQELAHHAAHVMTDKRQALEEARPRESWDRHPRPSDKDPDERRHGHDFTWHYALALDGAGHRDAASTARGHYTDAKVQVANERHGRGLSRDFPGSGLSPHRPPDLSHLPPMIDSQREGLAATDDRHYSRKMLDVASRPEPGLRLWRGERRPAGEDIPGAHTVGMHWSAKPEGVITGHEHGQAGSTRPVVWQSRLEHPEFQAIPRSHPVWNGIHQSMPSEAEVRLHPGSSVHVEGAWVGEPGQESTVHPLHPEHNPPGWQWHPVGRHVPVSHRPGQHGVVDYADVGIPKEGAATPALYHGSMREFAPGAVLTPEARDGGSVHSGDYVYATTSPDAARYFASMHDTSPETDQDVHVHRVEPVGGVEPDDFPAEDERFAHGNVRAKALRVMDHSRVPGHWARTAATIPEYGREPEFVKAPEHLGEEERSAHHEKQFQTQRDWKAGIRRGLSLGHLTPGRAGELGYHASGHDHQDSYHPETTGWHPMPEHLYHVTTDLPGVREHGLRSQRELGITTGHGLGSSEPDTISMTDHEPTARGILSGLHEYHHFLNHGDPEDLIGRARRGDRGSRPFHHDLIRNDGGGDWEEGQPLPRRLDAITRGKTLNHFFGTQAEIDKHHGPGWRPHPRSEPYTGRTDGQPMHSEWERDATPEEQLDRKSQLFKAFSTFREHAGGPYNPGFMSNDAAKFSKMNPDHFALLHVRPRPGAQGYRLPGEHEWRTTTGDAVEAHKAERLKNGQPREAAVKKPAAARLPAPARTVPITEMIESLPARIASCQPGSAREAMAMLGEVPGLLRAVSAALGTMAARCDGLPVDDEMPAALLKLAAHAAEGAEHLSGRLSPEGAWKDSSRQPCMPQAS